MNKQQWKRALHAIERGLGDENEKAYEALMQIEEAVERIAFYDVYVCLPSELYESSMCSETTMIDQFDNEEEAKSLAIWLANTWLGEEGEDWDWSDLLAISDHDHQLIFIDDGRF